MSGAPRLGQEQLNILLVDDNIFIRNCINQCLQHMGFRGMRGCSNGIDAIEYLRPPEKKPGSNTAQPIIFDLVICDLVMPQLNGLQLLQWVRTNKDSPNRFLPFIMISGAADGEQVHAARDTGANEFIAKPFSIGSIMTRLQAVIDRPRQYVATRNFFGPSRRRVYKDLPKDRRRAGEGHATVVYSATDVKRQPEGSDVYLFKLPNLLKQKMGLENMKTPFELPDVILGSVDL